MDEPKKLEEIDVFYQYAADHRTINADGAWLALTPQLAIQIAFHNELRPMPARVRHKVVDGALGQEIDKDVKTGLVRETAVTITLNPMLALQLVQLLQGMIKQIKLQVPEEIQKEMEKTQVIMSASNSQKEVK